MKKQSQSWKAKLTNVVVEREYQLTNGRRKQKVYLRFGKPRPVPEGPGYYCVYSYEGLGDADRTRYMRGADSLQALQLAVQSALLELVSSSAYSNGILTWKGSYDLASGFSVSDAISHLLIKDHDPPAPIPRRGMRKRPK